MMLSVLGQRELGVQATGFARLHSFHYEPAPDIVPPRSRFGYLRAATRAVRAHDLVHFYFGPSFLPHQLDAPWLPRLGKRVAIEFLGSDVRMPSVEARRNPHYVRIEMENDVRATRLMSLWSKVTQGHVIVGDHSLDVFLAPHFPHIHVIGAPRVDTRQLVPAPPDPRSKRMRVVHSPTHSAAKGTEFVRRATAELAGAGAPIDYIEVHDLSHQEALEVYRSADLIVDQLCSGSYGVFAAEAMSLAKPVVCYLLPEIEATYPSDVPIINASPCTLTQVLAEWVERPHERHERGLASRAYAERVHDHRIVARRMLEVYEALP
jgi:glycosyltransferase involved in cell wall biosynthesis